MPDVRAVIDFIQDLPLYEREKPYVAIRDVASKDTHTTAGLTNIQWDAREVDIHDLREDLDDYSLARNGFEVLEVPDTGIPQFKSLKDIQQYEAATETLLLAHLGADFVICYDCKLRKNTPPVPRQVDLNDPLNMVIPPRGLHNSTFDYIPVLLREALSAEERAKCFVPGARLQIINTWRPLLEQIEDQPLALCDPRSVCTKDLIAMDRVFPHETIESYFLRYNPQHRFMWLSDQRCNELILMKQFDTDPTAPVRHCPHVSFHNPNARKNAPARQSVETRSLVVFLKEESTKQAAGPVG